MKTLSQRAAEFVSQLETRGTTVDMTGIEILLRDVAYTHGLEPVAEITSKGTLKLLNVNALDYGTRLYTSPPLLSGHRETLTTNQPERGLEMVSESLARDAARYRYLRDSIGDAWDDAIGALTGVDSPEQIDAAVDAAMEKDKGSAT